MNEGIRETKQKNTTTLQAQRQLYTGERAKTLHIYMLYSWPSVRFHLRVVAVHPDQPRDTRKEDDHTLTESALTILLGTIMSAEGQTAHKSPIRWMAMSSEWARKVRLSIAGLPSPIGYGANRATPCSQFVCKETLPTYYNNLCHIQCSQEAGLQSTCLIRK
jgi:hypothetical protein